MAGAARAAAWERIRIAFWAGCEEDGDGEGEEEEEEEEEDKEDGELLLLGFWARVAWFGGIMPRAVARACVSRSSMGPLVAERVPLDIYSDLHGLRQVAWAT